MLQDQRVKYERKMEVHELEFGMKLAEALASANFDRGKFSQELCEVKAAYNEKNLEVGRLEVELNDAIATCRDKLASHALDLAAHLDVKLVAELAGIGVAADMKHVSEVVILQAAHEEKYGAERLQFEGKLAANLTDYNKLKEKVQ